jgi:multidrug efflux pump subunit AcrA (membrane-fusion protein)
MVIISAQIDQVEAELSLTTDKIARAKLVAPFDGVIVSGDLNQLLGTPVEQGKVLFQIAPLDAYRVILQVEERDIAHVATGQRGELTLSGIPDQLMDFTLTQITPVSTSLDGRNYFRVEAHLLNASERVRPGMEGLGKVEIGQRKLIWIWGHTLFDWLRLSIWKWLP